MNASGQGIMLYCNSIAIALDFHDRTLVELCPTCILKSLSNYIYIYIIMWGGRRRRPTIIFKEGDKSFNYIYIYTYIYTHLDVIYIHTHTT